MTRPGAMPSPGRSSVNWLPRGEARTSGQALIDAVSAIEDVADTSEKSGRMPRRLVLISDLPQGSRLEALGDFEWPSDVDLELKTVADDGSNAGLAVLAESAESDPSETGSGRRVRVLNDQSSRREKFELVWVDEHGKEAADRPGRGLRSARREPRGARAAAQGFAGCTVCFGYGATSTDLTTRSTSRMSDEREDRRLHRRRSGRRSRRPALLP